ncbi:MAG: YebC/PmpR family DNA-binding transcriptional regulator, partial [Alphaproteobacteria bacterium]
MAGHSKWANIQHRKGAQDKKRGKLFTKIIRELVVAAKAGGGDPEANPSLRVAIANAKSSNMPKDTMERAIKRGSGDDDDTNYEEIRYEGFGPEGIALLVETLTDNRNRTASDVRSTFAKYGGNLGATGSVVFMFDHVGEVLYTADKASADDMFEAALEAGADNVESSEEGHIITCTIEQFHVVKEALEKTFGEPTSAKLTWNPNLLTPITADKANGLMKLIDVLEDND